MTRRIVITSALPYANGDIHLGHMVEHLITDYWARFQRMRGHEVLALCADDTHGAPIMVEAKKLGVSPESLITKMNQRHQDDFRDFLVEYDHYSSTHSPVNQDLCDEIFKSCQKAGAIHKKDMEQCYCPNDQLFLPDRFVRGSCPSCGSEDQYGDSCDKCSAVYQPIELKDPRCSLCGTKPELRSSEHLFFKLDLFREFLQGWVDQHTDRAVSRKLAEWLDGELQDWCLTRDEPYFGFEVPGFPGKYYYVWVDAPVGYITTTKEWCNLNQRDLNEFWRDPKCEIYHNIGKDIVYFHTLFWPAMLKTADYNLPKRVFVHGMLTVNGEKLSKSRGNFINARTYLNSLDPEYLRYYFAAKQTASISDLDLSFDDMAQKINSDLIGKITNIASRCAQMLNKKLEGQLARSYDTSGAQLISLLRKAEPEIAKLYEERMFARVITRVRELAEDTNRFIDDHKPWKIIKEDPKQAQDILTSALNAFRLLVIYLTPVLPRYSLKVSELFGEENYQWSHINLDILDRCISPYQSLLTRIEKDTLEQLVEQIK